MADDVHHFPLEDYQLVIYHVADDDGYWKDDDNDDNNDDGNDGDDNDDGDDEGRDDVGVRELRLVVRIKMGD